MADPHNAPPPAKSRLPREPAPEAGKPLRTLSRLLREISRRRSEIALRKSLLSGLRQRLLAEAHPLQEKLLAIRLDTLRILGRHLQSGRLQRRGRKLLELALYDLAEELESGFGVDLRADRKWIFAEEAEAAAEKGDTEAGELDEAYRGADGYRESDFPERGGTDGRKDGGAGDRWENRGDGNTAGGWTGSAGHSQAAQGKAAERDRAVAGDIRALYLMLARALHPDKEPDPARREEKTAWMQKVTAAYAERDLAKLLDILSVNPLQAVEPYLTRASEPTLRGFSKRLRRELEALNAQAAAMESSLDPFLARFLVADRVDDFALNTFLANARQEISFLKKRRDAYRTTAGVDGLVEALRSHDWRELL
jgi:hypothetical protein